VRLLLDAHTLIWAADDPSRLSRAALTAVQDPANDRLLSGGTIWEIAIKVALKKLTLTQPFQQWMDQAIADLKLSLLPITVVYADVQANLPHHHRNPFDRLLVAQALSESLTIVSTDVVFDLHGATRLW
jgi:PIN domain nuclease of toxin-antitoxin system